MQNKYQPIIGLEVHVELKTKSKMFCSCSADYFGKKPNTYTCPVCLGLPGALPVPNKTAIEWCVMIGLALNCDIPLFSKFDRKNYFYPDLPKGYQISQYDEPFCLNGSIVISRSPDVIGATRNPTEISHSVRNDKKIIRIRRVHMEEDTGKLLHEGDSTLIDFNRSGVPLVEIVTEPDFENEYQVLQYLKKLQQIVRYLDVSNADMEKGDMRLEPNISLKPVILANDVRPESDAGQASMTLNKEGLPPYKVEVKNINSFRFVDKVIQYEIKRQEEILERGKIPPQETRGWDEAKQKTVSQRSKEEAHDYRYFPEPDIPPIQWKKSQITKLKSQMPELPDAKFGRFMTDYSLSYYNAEILTREKNTADYFEKAVHVARHSGKPKAHPESPKDAGPIRQAQGKQASMTKVAPKQIANFIINKKIDLEKILPAELIRQIITSSQTVQINEKELEAIIQKVLSENPKAVEDYKKGKETVIMFLVGQVMKRLTIKPNVKQIKNMLVRQLKQ